MWFYLHKILENAKWSSDNPNICLGAWVGVGRRENGLQRSMEKFWKWCKCSLSWLVWVYTGQIYCTLIPQSYFYKDQLHEKMFQHYQSLYRLVGNAIYFFYHNLLWRRVENSFPYPQIYSLRRQLKCYICVWTRWILHV